MGGDLNRLAVKIWTIRGFDRDFYYDGFTGKVGANVEAWRFRRLAVIITGDAVVRLLYPAFLPVRFTRRGRRNQLRFRGFLLHRSDATVCLIGSDLGFHSYVVLNVRFFGSIIERFASLFHRGVIALARNDGRVIGTKGDRVTRFNRLFCVYTGVNEGFRHRYLVQAPDERRLSFGTTLAYLSVMFRKVGEVVYDAGRFRVVATRRTANKVFELFRLLVAFVVGFANHVEVRGFVSSGDNLRFGINPIVRQVARDVECHFNPLLGLFPVYDVLANARAFIRAVNARNAPLMIIASRPGLDR